VIFVATQVSQMQNVVSNSDCEAYFDGDKKWMCFMAPYVSVFIQTPVFMLNSFYDTWQLSNILNLTCVCASRHLLPRVPFLLIRAGLSLSLLRVLFIRPQPQGSMISSLSCIETSLWCPCAKKGHFL
jgi:hypothetical protein